MEIMGLNGSADDGSKTISLVNLKSIIKNIAECHSQEISKQADTVSINKRDFDIVKITQSVTSQKCFNGFDQELLNEGVKILEASVNDIMDSSILVRDQGIRELVPLTYEVLRLIFASTNEKFRQIFFHELMEYYYTELDQNLKSLSLKQVILKDDFNQQVKAFLPIVKLETAQKFLNRKDFEAQKLFEEVISNITSFFKYSRLNQEDIYAVINTKLGSTNYELLTYELIPLDERNGHLGDYFKLKIHVEFGSNKKVLNLFAKFMTPKLEIMKELVRSGPSKKEEFFYLTYLPVLDKHGLKSLLDFSPTCYFSRLNDVLVLDDMVSLGFTALTPNIKLEYDGLMFVVKQIAKFHAGSIILEELISEKEGKKVTLDEIYGDYLKEVIFNHEEKFMSEMLENALKNIHYFAEKFSELNKTLSDHKFIEKIDLGWPSIIKKVSKSEKFKNIICHGDMYVGNMLFRFDPNGICHGAILVDFQILRYCPAGHDLLFFIYQNSFKETRDKHFRQLIDGYYLELSKHLEMFDFDIAKIYPKNEFEESLNYMKSQALLQALFYSPFNMLDPKTREDIMQDKEMVEKYFSGGKTALLDLGLTNEAYKKVMVGLMTDLVELFECGLL